MQNDKHYLPSDIQSKALRDTYYTVQKIISLRYEAMLSKAPTKRARQTVVEHFKREIRNAIEYYVNLSSK